MTWVFATVINGSLIMTGMPNLETCKSLFPHYSKRGYTAQCLQIVQPFVDGIYLGDIHDQRIRIGTEMQK